MNKREWVLKAFRGEDTGAVPAGFWFHYVPDELADGFADPGIIEKNIAGHRAYYRTFKPDFMKIMTDGFFIYPNRDIIFAEKAADLRSAVSIGKDHPWIERQVEFAKTITGIFGGEILSFYNIFAPATTFKFIRRASGMNPPGSGDADQALGAFIREDRDAVIHALGVIAGDLAVLAQRVIAEGGAGGIYFSTQDIAAPEMTRALHEEVTAPGDFRVLEAAASAGSLNILHICGYEGHRNVLDRFTGYPAQAFNWASAIEGVSLNEGKRLFGGKPVIGGFDNTAQGVLCSGSEAEVKAETKRLLGETGRTGVILGADCTIPRGMDLRRLDWVREAARSI
jgi:uroporphyrinogen decarboxylase